MRAATLLSPIFILSLTTECTSNVSLGNLGGGAAGARRTLSPSPTAEHSTSKASAEILGASTAAVALLRALAELRQPAAATVATKATGGEALPLHATRPAARGHLHSPLHLLISPARLGTDDITAFSAHRSTASAAPTKLSAETTAVSLKSCTKGSNCASEDEAVSGSGSGVARQWQSPQRRALTFRGGGGDVAGYETGVIDEDLYSRQLYVMGKSAMVKMGKADVLISGMRYIRVFVIGCDGCRRCLRQVTKVLLECLYYAYTSKI